MPAPSGTAADFRALAFVLRAVALFAIVTGFIDALGGTWLLSVTGAEVPALADPALDSQFRFRSAAWFGFGLVLWWVTRDLAARGQVLILLSGAFLLGGLGRIISIPLYGPPSPLLLVFLVIEVLGPVAVIFWHRRLTRRP